MTAKRVIAKMSRYVTTFNTEATEFKGDYSLLSEIRIEYDALSPSEKVHALRHLQGQLAFINPQQLLSEYKNDAAIGGVGGAIAVPVIDAYMGGTMTAGRIALEAVFGCCLGATFFSVIRNRDKIKGTLKKTKSALLPYSRLHDTIMGETSLIAHTANKALDLSIDLEQKIDGTAARSATGMRQRKPQ